MRAEIRVFQSHPEDIARDYCYEGQRDDFTHDVVLLLLFLERFALDVPPLTFCSVPFVLHDDLCSLVSYH